MNNPLTDPKTMVRFYVGSSFFFGSLWLYFSFMGAFLFVGKCILGLIVSLFGVATNLIWHRSQEKEKKTLPRR